MAYINAVFNCGTCSNKKYCAELTRMRTNEVRDAIGRDTSPIPFIKKEAPPNITISASCGLETERVSLDDISSSQCTPRIEWDLCDACKKQNVCVNKEATDRWAEQQKDEVGRYLQSAPIAAPWIDSVVTCKDKPDKKSKKIGFHP